MPRRTALVAGLALALGAGVATLSASSAGAVSARPASASAVRVTTDCKGAGTATLTARKTASGGTFAKTKLTGLKQRAWSGATLVTSPADLVDDLLTAVGLTGDGVTPPEMKYSQHGTLTESVTSPRKWPHMGVGFYASSGGDTCVDMVQVRRHGIRAVSAAGELDIRPRDGVVSGFLNRAAPKSRWKVAVTVWTPSGTQTATRRIHVKKNGLAASFTHFKALSTYTKVRFSAVNLKTGRVRKIIISRTV